MREQASNDVVAWIGRGVRPRDEDVVVSHLSRIGLAWTPILRVDDPISTCR